MLMLHEPPRARPGVAERRSHIVWNGGGRRPHGGGRWRDRARNADVWVKIEAE